MRMTFQRKERKGGSSFPVLSDMSEGEVKRGGGEKKEPTLSSV